MPRRNGSYFGLTVNPTPSVASGIWRVREAEEFLRVNKWPATPGVPGSPVGSAGNAQVSLTWSAPTLGTPPTDYQVQYSSNSGSTWTTFADGTSTATSAVVTGLTNGTGYIFRVRAVNALGEGPYGAASGAVTPSAISAALLLHFDGTNGSTTFTDSSPNGLTVTANGDAAISTAHSKFGGASGYFSGGANRLTIPDSEWFTASNDDFTIEAWLHPTAWNTGFNANHWCGQSNNLANNGNRSWSCFLDDGIAGFYYTTNGVTDNVQSFSAADVELGSWFHYAASIQSGVVRVFVNGLLAGTHTLPGAIFDSTADLCIGTFGKYAEEGYPGLSYTGYIDELRIVKGTAVYTANFTPPTAPF
jgi:hypothetical protein